MYYYSVSFQMENFYCNLNEHSVRRHLGFSYFELKIRLIRLIRLGLSFQKQKFLSLNSQPTDSQSGVITITPQSQL